MKSWMDERLDDRERKLIHQCLYYVKHGAPGLPGHALMVIISKLVETIEFLWRKLPPEAFE